MRVAIFTPLPPEVSRIADYSADLIPYLSLRVTLDVYTDPSYADVSQSRFPNIGVYAYDRFDAYSKEYDASVYQIANSKCSVGPYLAFKKHNGIIMLHDLNLSGIFGTLAFENGPAIRFIPLLAVNENIRASLKSFWRFISTRRMPGKDDYWMSNGIIRHSRAIMVHNQYAFDYVTNVRARNQNEVWKVHHGAPPFPPTVNSCTNAEAKRILGLEQYGFVVASFGTVDENKGFSAALSAFGKALEHIPNSVYLFVGSHDESHIRKVEALSFRENVRLVGRVTMSEFYRYIIAADACVSLRYPSRGEASGPLLRLMSVGKPVAVSDHAQFKEFPDDTMRKIALGREEVDLAVWLVEMAQFPTKRAQLGARAAIYIKQNHTMEQAAAEYVQTVRAYLKKWPKYD